MPITSWVTHAYTKVQGALRKISTEHFGLDDVAVAKPNAPILRLLRLAVRTGPGITGIRFTKNVINGHLIEDAYIYRLN